jgi:isoleucyl-tRNA synthetase
VRKDSLYCDPADAGRRRAARTVLDLLFDHLTAWLAPFLCFTAEEAWLSRHPGGGESVHLRLFPEVPAAWRDDALAAKWETLRQLRRVVTGALEIKRAEKAIGSSLQACPIVYAGEPFRAAAHNVDLAELFITSDARFAEGEAPADSFALADVPGVRVTVALASGDKCERCWKVLGDVGSHPEHQGVCLRCADAVDRAIAAAE